jgi:hypothetical protein
MEIKGFLTIFAWWWKDPDLYLWLTDPDADPGGQKKNIRNLRIRIPDTGTAVWVYLACEGADAWVALWSLGLASLSL